LQGEEPEFFDRALLLQSPEVRQEYFEQRCLIEHPRLLEALDAILEAICAPGEGALTRRPGTMLLVIGPARVGKRHSSICWKNGCWPTRHPGCNPTRISSPLPVLLPQSQDQVGLTGSIFTDQCFASLVIPS